MELSSSVYFSEEGDSFVTITITKSAVTAMDIDVIILLRDESALGGFAENCLHVLSVLHNSSSKMVCPNF